jgi:hypothetical protein
MSVNIYRQSDTTAQIINTSVIDTDSITTSALSIKGGTKGEVLVIADNLGTVDGILPSGRQYDVFQNNLQGDGLPGWSNDIDVNDITCNGIYINGTQDGDLLQIVNNKLERIPIGTPNQVLTVGNVNNGVWQDVMSIIPDPFTRTTINATTMNTTTLGATTVNTTNTNTTNLNITGPATGQMFLDSLRNVYTERAITRNVGGVYQYQNFQTLDLFSTSTIQGRTYKLTLSFNCRHTGNNTSTIRIEAATTISYDLTILITEPNSITTAMKIFTSPTTGIVDFYLIGSSTGLSDIVEINWCLEPLGY